MTEEAQPISSVPLPKEEGGAEIAKKDITEDIILADEKREAALETVPKADHAVVTLLDIAFDTGTDYLKKEGYPAPMDGVYKHFSRPFLNKAAWCYLPDQQLPEDPRVALLLGVGGLVLAFSPALIEVYKRRKAEEKEGSEEKKEEAPKEVKPELITAKEGLEAPLPEAPPWMKRIEAGGML